ncbi:MAG TPA: hypothetical protein VK613_01725 [Gaiellaceae bacterium]|nr:hypothetical protein [Gaiellaceae bacterium]
MVGVLFVSVALGLLLGWLAGSTGIGLLVGSVIGIPLSVYTVYWRYRDSF